MARPVQAFPVNLTVKYFPAPKDRVGAWRAGILLLLDVLHDEKKLVAEEAHGSWNFVGSRDAERGVAALFSLEVIAQRQKASTPGSVLAWFIGHDGSAQRMAMAVR